MSSEMYEKLRNDPNFKKLVTRRGRFAWTMSFVVLTMFYGFFLLVAFKPALLGQPVAEGSMVTVGVLIEFFMFVFFWVLTGVYVYRANGEFDTLTQNLIKVASKENK